MADFGACWTFILLHSPFVPEYLERWLIRLSDSLK
jgi:hypothetical protein